MPAPAAALLFLHNRKDRTDVEQLFSLLQQVAAADSIFLQKGKDLFAIGVRVYISCKGHRGCVQLSTAAADEAIAVTGQTNAAGDDFQHINPGLFQGAFQSFIRSNHSLLRYNAKAAFGIPLLDIDDFQLHLPRGLQ